MNAVQTPIRTAHTAPAAQPGCLAEDLEALHTMAWGAYHRGDYLKAASRYGYLATRRPASRRFLKGLGASQFMLGQYGRAVQTFAFLLLNHPEDVEALCFYGHALLLTGEREEARSSLELAVQLGRKPTAATRRAEMLLTLIQH